MATMFLGNKESSPVSIDLHPVVLFAILDHFVRRNEGQKRVIGTLLGRVVDGQVEIVNSFPVPHQEKLDEVAVGKEFNRQMYGLHRQVNKTEEIVGWYATTVDGSAFTEHSCLIHDFYSQECKQPIHLVVDTSLINNALSIKAFISSRLTIEPRMLAARFQQIEVRSKSSEPEKIGIETMLKSIDAGSDSTIDSTGSEMKNLQQSIESLLAALTTTCDYVDQIVDQKKPVKHDVGQLIARAVAAVPRIKAQELEKMFDDSVQDLLMVSYLSNLTRTQLAVAEKLNCTF